MVMEKDNGFDPGALEEGAALMLAMEARGATSTEGMITCHRHLCLDRAPEKDEKKAAASVTESAKVDASPLRRLNEARAVLNRKARAVGEYAAVVTRQGVSMFGESKIGSMVKEGAGEGEGDATRWGSLIRSKVGATAGEYYAAITAHRGYEPDTGSMAEGGGPKVQG